MSDSARGSRERLLAAIDGAAGAAVPCSFMIFRALRLQCADELEFARRQAEMGLDVRVQIEDLPIRFPSDVDITEWTETDPATSATLLHRRYRTPKGDLTAAVRRSDDWPYGNSLPLFDDYVTPRSAKYLVAGEADLPALRHLLAEPTGDDIRGFREEAARRKRFADDGGQLLQAGWKSGRYIPSEDPRVAGANGGIQGIDTLMWLCGGVEPLIWGFEKPDLLREVIDIVARWNRKRLAIHLETGADLVVRRAWYEGADFWSPDFYRRFILPGLKKEVKMTHEAGCRFGYILTSGMLPLADELLKAGIDVIIGIDPVQGKGTVLEEVASVFGGKLALWGGVSGPMTVESGSETEVRQAVKRAVDTLGPTGRFILSPVDNVREDTPRTWDNVRAFIETWRRLGGP